MSILSSLTSISVFSKPPKTSYIPFLKEGSITKLLSLYLFKGINFYFRIKIIVSDLWELREGNDGLQSKNRGNRMNFGIYLEMC